MQIIYTYDEGAFLISEVSDWIKTKLHPFVEIHLKNGYTHHLTEPDFQKFRAAWIGFCHVR